MKSLSRCTAVFVVWVFLATATWGDQFRTFRDTRGRDLTARLVRVDGNAVSVIRQDGTPFRVDLRIFSKQDQQYIRQWARQSQAAPASGSLSATLSQTPSSQGNEGAVNLSRVAETPNARMGRFKNPIPPKVLMGFASIPNLADVDPNQWTYVREHLDGLWLNAAGTGIKDVAKMASNIKTRNYYFIGPVSKLQLDNQGKLVDVAFKLNFFDQLGPRAVDPSLVLVNDYITKDGRKPERYYCDDFFPQAIEYLKEQTGGVNPFGRRLFITTRNGQFIKNVYDKTFDRRKPLSLKGRAFSTMLYAAQGGGHVYETDFFDILKKHKDRYIEAYNRARELGGKFVLLCPRGHEGTPAQYSLAMVKAYQWLRVNELFPDEIVIIHYSRTAAAGEIEYLDMLPMVNPQNPSLPAPGSFTGAMYWAIKQRELALGQSAVGT